MGEKMREEVGIIPSGILKIGNRYEKQDGLDMLTLTHLCKEGRGAHLVPISRLTDQPEAKYMGRGLSQM